MKIKQSFPDSSSVSGSVVVTRFKKDSTASQKCLIATKKALTKALSFDNIKKTIQLG
ncbi:hypothetical protein HMPREF1345_02460 [Enterococcus faecium TX1337RF]|nr:hypothetical protein HMPREF1345_02460 [Enterococcus faecium TX1337RF]